MVRGRILVVDDNAEFLEAVARFLSSDFVVDVALSVPEALRQLSDREYDAAVVDMRFREGPEAGLQVLDYIKSNNMATAPIVLTGHASVENAIAALRDFDSSDYILKSQRDTPVRLLRSLLRIVKGKGGLRPRSFIVHGHDGATLYELKDYLQSTLGLPPPLVLRDLPSLGRTVVEKLEEETCGVDLVFVLLTPDDIAVPPGVRDLEKRRARQNVIFELGYFYGRLQRSSGRILLLYKGDLELPSDITGIVYVDITGGIVSAGEGIRKELRDWL